MLFKLALGNVKKSMRDYMIYFLTLTFGICLFYTFNSIEAQKAMMTISGKKLQSMQVLSEAMGYVSMFISVILAFLVLYSNQFLIKRRKKELGIYLTLGMEKRKVSLILVFETLLVGIISLLCGLGIGIFLSQGLSIITAKMFAVDLTAFRFIFSMPATIKTISYFGIIFLIVMVFNAGSIAKVKLINLLYAKNKNQKLKIKSIKISVAIFILSVVCLGISYYLIIKNGMTDIDLDFLMSLVFGTIGTLLFFMSLSGFLLKVLQTNEKIYFKNLNMFVLRQINSKINTTFISMSIICIMLLISVGTLSSGLGIAKVVSDNLKNNTPYDATIRFFEREEDVQMELSQIEKMYDGFDGIAKEYVKLMIYKGDLRNGELLPELEGGKIEFFSRYPVEFISVDDYNKLISLQGKKIIELAENEYAVTYNMYRVKEYYETLMKNKRKIKVNGMELIPAINKPYVQTLECNDMPVDMGKIIVSQNVINKLKQTNIIVNVNYLKDKLKAEEKINKITRNLYKNSDGEIGIYATTKQRIVDDTMGLKVLVSYIGIYVGIIFMVSSVVILSLQQLSEASDNIERYELLKKIGTDKRTINKALFAQIFIYFMMPLGLAIIHSIVGVSVANSVVRNFGKLNILSNSIMISGFVLLIYGGYFIATYIGSKSIINSKR